MFCHTLEAARLRVVGIHLKKKQNNTEYNYSITLWAYCLEGGKEGFGFGKRQTNEVFHVRFPRRWSAQSAQLTRHECPRVGKVFKSILYYMTFVNITVCPIFSMNTVQVFFYA